MVAVIVCAYDCRFLLEKMIMFRLFFCTFAAPKPNYSLLINNYENQIFNGCLNGMLMLCV